MKRLKRFCIAQFIVPQGCEVNVGVLKHEIVSCGLNLLGILNVPMHAIFVYVCTCMDINAHTIFDMCHFSFCYHL